MTLITKPLSKLTYFFLYRAFNPKMLSQSFFNRFSSNFHQFPIFWHWSQIHFQNWHIFLCITPIPQNAISAVFQADLAKIFTCFLTFDTDEKSAFKIDIFFSTDMRRLDCSLSKGNQANHSTFQRTNGKNTKSKFFF